MNDTPTTTDGAENTPAPTIAIPAEIIDLIFSRLADMQGIIGILAQALDDANERLNDLDQRLTDAEQDKAAARLEKLQLRNLPYQPMPHKPRPAIRPTRQILARRIRDHERRLEDGWTAYAD